jgi:hypothetical protein
MRMTFDEAGRPLRDEITIPRDLWNFLTDPQRRNFAFLNQTTVTGRVDNGGAIAVKIGAATDLRLASDGKLVLGVQPQIVTLDDGGRGQRPGVRWQLRLVNFGFQTGDIASPGPVPQGYEQDASVSGGWSRDRIDFSVEGRTWTLTDDALAPVPSTTDVEQLREELLRHLVANHVQQHGWISLPVLRSGAALLWTMVKRRTSAFMRPAGKKRVARPPQVGTGVLSAPALVDETAEQVHATVRDIVTLLSFALCTAVDWTECTLVSEDGYVLWWQRRAARFARFEKGQARIDQDSPQTWGVIRGFLEECHPPLAADRDRMMQTVGVYVEAQLTDTTLERAALLNMLLDRLQKQVNAGRLGPQIDAELDDRLDRKEFKERLGALLGELSGKWTKEMTGRVVSEIKRLNAGPGYGKAVRIAFESLGLRGFDTLDLGLRHVLLHDAELPLSVDEVVPYLTELDLLVFLLVARLLGYTGQFFHPHLAPAMQRIDTLLAAGNATAAAP